MTTGAAEALAPQKLEVAESVLPRDPSTSLSLNLPMKGEGTIEGGGIGEASGRTPSSP